MHDEILLLLFEIVRPRYAAKSVIGLTRHNEISGQFAFRGLSYWARRVLATDSRERRIASQSSKEADGFRHFLASSVICKGIIAGRHEFSFWHLTVLRFTLH